MTTRIGVLLVHGIGEQHRFEHLKTEARNIARAIRAQLDPEDSVRVVVRTSLNTSEDADQEIWKAENEAPVFIEIQEGSGQDRKVTEIHFDEVWWADLDEPTTIPTAISFWCWGLSLWTNNGYKEVKKEDLPLHRPKMRPPREPNQLQYLSHEDLKNLLQSNKIAVSKLGEDINKLLQEQDISEEEQEGIDGISKAVGNFYIEYVHADTPRPWKVSKRAKLGLWGRLYLFLIAFVVFLVLPFLFLLNKLLNVFGVKIQLDIISQFVGDVKLYQQNARIDRNGTIEDLEQQPRVTIRRRMIEALVRMAMRKYDRWYLFAHSQGTVVAYNGLTEIEQALPNYLSRELWDEIKRLANLKLTDPDYEKYVKLASSSAESVPGLPSLMMPPRPAWLEPHEIIDRRELFARLRGFLTYGSPLDKFAILWPAIVPLNRDEKVFENFEWINIYDPTDPVADYIKHFQPECERENNPGNSDELKTYLKPRNIAYKADSWHLLSHINYLTFKPRRSQPLVSKVASWLLHGDIFTSPSASSCQWPGIKTKRTYIYRFLSTLVWPIAAIAIAVFISKLNLLASFLASLLRLMESSATSLPNPRFYLWVALGTVVATGIIRYLSIRVIRWLSRSKEKHARAKNNLQ
jgi:hypothetical protein